MTMNADAVFAQSERLATELIQKLPAAALAGLIGSLTAADVALAADYAPPTNPPTQTKEGPKSLEFPARNQNAPAVKSSPTDFQLPEGNQWRYSEFINAVQNSKVERVRFSKDGGQLQVGLKPSTSTLLCCARVPGSPVRNSPAHCLCPSARLWQCTVAD